MAVMWGTEPDNKRSDSDMVKTEDVCILIVTMVVVMAALTWLSRVLGPVM